MSSPYLLQSLWPQQPYGNYTPVLTPGSSATTMAPGPGTLPSTSRITPTTLANGAECFAIEVPNQFTSKLSALLPFNATMPGLQGLISKLLIDGSEATRRYLEDLSTQGIDASLRPTQDGLLFSVSGPQGQEGHLAQIALHLLTRPTIDPNEFEKIKGNLIEEQKQTLSRPISILDAAVRKRLFGPTHPYALSSEECIQALRKFTLDQVLGYHRQALALPQQIRWMMVSPQPASHQVTLLNQAVQASGFYASPYQPAWPLPGVPSLPTAADTRRVLVAKEGVNRAQVLYAWRTPPENHPDYPAYQLIQANFSSPSSAFYKVIRVERGLTYTPIPLYDTFRTGGYFGVISDVDFNTIGETMKAYNDTVTEILKTPITPQQVASLKNMALREVREHLQSTWGITKHNTNRLSRQLSPETLAEAEWALQRVTPQDVQRVLDRYFNPKNNPPVVGILAPQAVLSKTFPGPAAEQAQM